MLSNPDSLPRGEPHLLVCFSHLRWDFVYQRPQHLLSRAGADHAVVYFEEPVVAGESAPTLQLRTKGRVVVATPHLPSSASDIEAVQRELLRALLQELSARNPRADLTFWYYTPMALGFSAEFPCDLCIYDCMDELSAFRGAPPELVSRERQLFERADLVFTGGRSLYEAKRERHPNVHLFPSSIDKDHFAAARTAFDAEPADQAGVAHPRVGFFGVIDERMDLDLVTAIADGAPHWQLVMLGPIVKIDAAMLPVRDNIHWLGSKAYQDLPKYMAGWDLGFMPFAQNESTRFISPTKTPEFLSAGLPVISTPIADVVSPYGENGLVAIVHDAKQAIEAGERLMQTSRVEHIRAVDTFLAGMSWDLTWAGMHNLMKVRGRSGRAATIVEDVARV